MYPSITLLWEGRNADDYLIFIDDVYIGAEWDGNHGQATMNYTIDIDLTQLNKKSDNYVLTILSSSLGIDNNIANMEGPESQDMKGIVGDVYILDTMDNIIQNITFNNWYHWIGLTGQNLNILTSNKIKWISPSVLNNPANWYRTYFSTPDHAVLDNGVLLLDIGNGNGMSRGDIYINGNHYGHYNNVNLSNDMVQQYYFIPNDALNYNGSKPINELIFFEHLPNVNPQHINIVMSTFVIP